MKFGVATQWGSSVFLGVSHAPIPMGQGQAPQNFLDLLPRPKNGVAHTGNSREQCAYCISYVILAK